MSKHALSAQEENRLVRMYLAGASTSYLAMANGIDPRTVVRIVRRRGAEVRPPGHTKGRPVARVQPKI